LAQAGPLSSIGFVSLGHLALGHMRWSALGLSLLAVGAAAADSCKDGTCATRTVATQAPVLLQFRSERTSVGAGFDDRFCGIASNTEQGNNYGNSDLAAAASAAGATRVWHYNWKMRTDVTSPGVLFVPMIKIPGQTDLPQANSNGVGQIVKGWNEPDDAGQAGNDYHLRTTPEAYGKAWVDDMTIARSKGYTEFVSPAMARDTIWLDFFLKSCMNTANCPQFVTYLSLHRYRTDCATYSSDADTSKNAGFRDDLSYVLTYYRLMQKYNARGFNIKGLVWDEIGCLINGVPSPEADQLKYMRLWYSNTIVKVKNGDLATIEKIRSTPYIMPRGPDALGAGVSYGLDMSRAMDGGQSAGDDAVKAIQSIVTVAWFSIAPGVNHLFVPGRGLSSLGIEWFNSCKTVGSGAAPAPTSTTDESVNSVVGPLNGKSGRIVNNLSPNRALYAQGGQLMADARSDDAAVWTLESQSNGGYSITNKASGMVLYATSDSNWGSGFAIGSKSDHVSSNGDGVWSFDPAGGNYRIVNKKSNRALYAQSGVTGSGGLGAGSPANNVGDDGIWRFELSSSSVSTPDPTPAPVAPTPAPSAGSLNGKSVRIVNDLSPLRKLIVLDGQLMADARSDDSGVWTLESQANGGYSITHKTTGLVVYATDAANWGSGFGIGSKSDHISNGDGIWSFDATGGNYRIVNKKSNRGLYAQPGTLGASGVGAGNPPNSIGSDGTWRLEFVSAQQPTPAPMPVPTPAPTLAPSPGGNSLEGATMRITNVLTQRTLYAAVGQNWAEGVGADARAGADGVWKLLVQPGGGYKIENKVSGRTLYAQSGRNWGDGLGAGNPSANVAADGVWNLIPKGGNKYRIENKLTGRALYAQSGFEWGAGVGAGAPAAAVGGDGEWTLTPN